MTQAAVSENDVGVTRRLRQAVEAPRENIFLVEPEKLVIVSDKTHPLYDERIDLPVDMKLVDSLLLDGNLVPINAVKDGDVLLVVDGRQRVKAAREANKTRRRNGGDPIRLRVRVVKGDESSLIRNMASTNAIRTADSPLVRARKMNAMVARGMHVNEIAVAHGLTVTSVQQILGLLDCSAKVQKAVDDGKIPDTIARKFAKLGKTEQDDLLTEMLVKGVTKGAAAGRAIDSVKRGKKKKVPHKAPTRAQMRKVADYIKALPSNERNQSAMNFEMGLRWAIGESDDVTTYLNTLVQGALSS